MRIAKENSSLDAFDFSVLRDLRRRERLTIGQISERSGVSPAVISKLERNRTRAELETLFRLARVFGLNTVDLLALAESRTASLQRSRSYDSGAFSFRTVRFANVECFHGFARKGARVSRPEIHHDDNEVCWVLKGGIRLTLPHERHDLKAGDALQFDAALEHTYAALDDCEILLLHLNKGKRF